MLEVWQTQHAAISTQAKLSTRERGRFGELEAHQGAVFPAGLSGGCGGVGMQLSPAHTCEPLSYWLLLVRVAAF